MRRLLFPVLLAGCQGKKDAPPPLPVIQVRDAQGTTLAELRPIRPCRGSIGPVELIVGGPPLVAQVGTTRWSGTSGANGTTLSRDGEAVARVHPVADPANTAVHDMHDGVLARIALKGGIATVSDGENIAVRALSAKNGSIVTAGPSDPLTITGTDDLVLAALLSARELAPEVRILAACERVLVKGS